MEQKKRRQHFCYFEWGSKWNVKKFFCLGNHDGEGRWVDAGWGEAEQRDRDTRLQLLHQGFRNLSSFVCFSNALLNVETENMPELLNEIYPSAN